MKLSLKEKLTDKEMRKFLITNDLVLDGFTGYQYAVCLCGIKKNDMGKYVEDIYNKKTLKKVQKKKNRAANKNWKMFTEN